MDRESLINLLLDTGFIEYNDSDKHLGWTWAARESGRVYVYQFPDDSSLCIAFYTPASGRLIYFPPGITAQDPASKTTYRRFSSFEELIEYLELD